MPRRWNVLPWKAKSTPRGTGVLCGMLLILFCLGGCGKSPQDADLPSSSDRREKSTDTLLLTGLDEAGRYAAAVPFEVDATVVQRGQETYLAFCATCHGASGDGRGPVFEATGVLSSDLRAEYVQQQPDGQIFVTISRGMGMMAGFESQLSPQDRWAVVAYLRTLQQEASN